MIPRLIDLPLPKAIARLAWPAMASTMLINIFSLVDAFWVGKLGTAALGGMTAATFVVWCLHALGLLVGTGVNAVVARRQGELDASLDPQSRAGETLGHGLLLALTLAFCASALGLWLGEELFGAQRLAVAVQHQADAYLRPMLWGLPLLTTWYACEAAFRGSGDTRTPMWILGVSLTFNAALDPILIFGAGPLPGLGIAGAAWATVVSQGVAVGVALWLLRKGALWPRLPRVRLELLGTLLRVGTPVAVTAFLWSGIYIVLTRLIADFGEAPLAAIGIGHRVEGLPYFAALGFSTAASTLVGQHLGAGQPAIAARAAWKATFYASLVIALMSALFALFAPQIVWVFSTDRAVIDEGARYLRIIALFEVGMAAELVLEGAFAGAGNTLPPMLVGVPLTLARVPLAWWLARHHSLGASGIWWAISLTTAIKGILNALWFARGRWKRSQI